MKKFGLSILFFSVIFGIVITLLGLRLKNGLKFNTVFNRQRWEEFYSQEKDFDLLFLGSSHSYCTFIPTIFDTINNVSSFNLSSSSQSPITSYFVLKEALKYNDFNTVILEVFPGTILESDNFMNALLNYDYIRSYDIKFELIITSDNYSDLLEILLPAYRYNNYKTTLFKDSPPINKSLTHKGISSKYFDRGYMKEVPLANFVYPTNFGKSNFDKKNISNRKVEAIENIIHLCRDNNIEFYVVTAPLNPLYYKNIDGYEIFHNFIDSLSKKNKFEYIDGNYHPETGIIEKDFKDSGHLFYSGAVKFSTWFANRLKSNKEINSSFVLDVETNN